MAMSKKDYVKFAEVIRVAKQRDYEIGAQVLRFFEIEIADLFAADNPRFDRERFAKACEVKA